MVFSTLSDPYLLVAFWTGIGALSLTLLIGAQIVYLRVALRRDQRQERNVIAKWRPILNAAITDTPPEQLPALHKKDQIPFLRFWVHLHQSVRGEASAGLNDVGYRLGCDGDAHRLLHKGNRAEKLLAILTIGHLRDLKAWPQLIEEARLQDNTTSVHALWALVQIDARKACHELMPLLLQRDDWPLSKLANILQEVREECEAVLGSLIPALEPERLPRALHLAEALRIHLPSALLLDLLHGASVDIVTAALRLSAMPDLLDAVRTHLGHADWRVRVQAAKALGRIGDHSDIARLQTLLGDPQWWVRYRAAQALLSLPFIGRSEVDSLCATVTDRYAADMLRQVAAEQELR
ncbi:hypothetical protein GCM10027343_25010 [Noviherbaspirillum agri]